MVESPHSPGTMIQLSGVHPTIELIACHAGPQQEARYAKNERNPIPLFPFYVLVLPHGGTWG